MDASKSSHVYRRQRKVVEKTTDAEWSSFLAACHRSGSRPVLLSVHSTYAADFVPVAMRFPQAILTNLSKNEAPRTDAALREHCAEVMRTLSIEPQVTTLVEAETREQAKSTKWFAFRAGRITASNAKAVCRTSIPSPSISLLKKESGKMIRCDSGSCKFKWFHFECVNLQRAPRAKKWYCVECKKLLNKV
ncbi:hypothetical protein MRX96_033179 [Rhipicephalus microplus]